MKASRHTVQNRVVAAGILVAVALSLSFVVLLFGQASLRNRRDAEFYAFRVMTGVLDVYAFDSDFDPAYWKELNGFGVYAGNGEALYRYGSAPRELENPARVGDSGLVRVSSHSVVLIRKMGSMPGPHMRHGMFGAISDDAPPGDDRLLRELVPDSRGFERRRLRDAPEGMRPRMPGMMRSGRYVFADVDMQAFSRVRRLRFISLFALIAVFVASLALVFVYSRRVARYRAREAENAHLVQLGEAARTLAHEIKNPLGVIRVQCATLTKILPSEFLRNVSVIEEETARLALLTDRLRDFLQNTAGNPRLVSAPEILASCAVRYAARIDVADWKGGAVAVFVDPDRLVQTLDNLLANALESQSREVPRLSFEVRQGSAVFTVADRGTGVAPELRSSLFTPFFTTKPKGSGIGLALSRRFMELAGGSLSYAERQGGGSVFTATLPIVADAISRGDGDGT